MGKHFFICIFALVAFSVSATNGSAGGNGGSGEQGAD